MSSNDLRDGTPPSAQLDFLETPDVFDEAAPRVRISARARRLSIRVYPDARVEVVVPPRARAADIERFVAAHRQWIDEKRTLALRNRPAPEPFPPRTITLQYTGETFELRFRGGAGPVRVVERDGVLQVSGGQGASLRPALRAWLMRAARQRLEGPVAARAAAMGVSYARVSIRRQRSRWGSCSAHGTISLNCCLLFQRADVVEYLVVHELAHVTDMNHSARFWQKVEKHCAHWRVLDRELLQGWRHVPRWVFSNG